MLYSKEAYEMILKAIRNEKVKFECFAGKRFCYMDPEGKIFPNLHYNDEFVDGRKEGFINAFYKLNHKHSPKCFNLCLPEKNILHKLDLFTLARYGPRILKKKIIF